MQKIMKSGIFCYWKCSQDCLHLILFITILLQSNITNVFKVDKYIINTVTHHHVDHGVGDATASVSRECLAFRLRICQKIQHESHDLWQILMDFFLAVFSLKVSENSQYIDNANQCWWIMKITCREASCTGFDICPHPSGCPPVLLDWRTRLSGAGWGMMSSPAPATTTTQRGSTKIWVSDNPGSHISDYCSYLQSLESSFAPESALVSAALSSGSSA